MGEPSDATSKRFQKFPEMSNDMAKFLFEHGATLVFLNFPVGSEFGIDFQSWQTGEKFAGLKMIPPGIHFIYWSALSAHGDRAPRMGFFHNFQQGEVLVRKWDAKTEELELAQVHSDEVERYRSNLRQMDSFLAPYPYQSYKVWFSLISHLTPRLLDKLRPEKGYVTAQSQLITKEEEFLAGVKSRVDRQHPTRPRFSDEQGLPIMSVKAGFQLRFHEIPQMRAVGAARTRQAVDFSEQLGAFVDGAGGTELDVLAELQFAFVCFLVGHVYEAFEQWKRLVHLLCGCSQALVSRARLFEQLLMTLHFQLKHCPEDFFVDIISKDNFLTTTLSRLFSNVQTQDGVDAALRLRAAKFSAHLTQRFKWRFDAEPDAPLLVHSASVASNQP